MKTKWTVTAIFILAVVIVSTPAFAGRYGYHYKHHFGHHRYYHRPYYSYHGSDVFIGTMIGFTLGALFWSSPPPPPVYIYRAYPKTIVYREKYIYESQRNGMRSDAFPTRTRRSSTVTSCLQTREYTTTMVIEGRTVEAYGTRCLQPDGSWRYGPAQPVPDN